LGGRFLAEIDRRLALVAASPTRIPFWQGPFRRVRPNVFPHFIYFRYDPATNLVSVVSVFHPSRNPADLLNRLGLP
jgi:hypothetical protein